MTSRRQATFPRRMVDSLGLREGDSLHIYETTGGILIKPHRFQPEKLASLREKIDPKLLVPNLGKIRQTAVQSRHLRD